MKNNITGRVETTINAPVSKVWEALTKPEIIKQYFFGTDTETDWKKGSPIIYKGEWQGKKYQDHGTILDIEKNKLIKYNYWSSMSGIEDKPENWMVLTYELKEKNDKVTVSIKQENIADEKTKTHSEENWKKVLEGLKKVVEKQNEKQKMTASL